ncbi:hypothetical protein [Enterococcus dispar]|uniref:hypothetical protein n=1 Tax=Enterococcus dispar TaxID=44009 RepID=UPI002490C44C|nr:hypothetical protein [Enterococcus dispar]
MGKTAIYKYSEEIIDSHIEDFVSHLYTVINPDKIYEDANLLILLPKNSIRDITLKIDEYKKRLTDDFYINVILKYIVKTSLSENKKFHKQIITLYEELNPEFEQILEKANSHKSYINGLRENNLLNNPLMESVDFDISSALTFFEQKQINFNQAMIENLSNIRSDKVGKKLTNKNISFDDFRILMDTLVSNIDFLKHNAAIQSLEKINTEEIEKLCISINKYILDKNFSAGTIFEIIHKINRWDTKRLNTLLPYISNVIFQCPVPSLKIDLVQFLIEAYDKTDDEFFYWTLELNIFQSNIAYIFQDELQNLPAQFDLSIIDIKTETEYFKNIIFNTTEKFNFNYKSRGLSTVFTNINRLLYDASLYIPIRNLTDSLYEEIPDRLVKIARKTSGKINKEDVKPKAFISAIKTHYNNISNLELDMNDKISKMEIETEAKSILNNTPNSTIINNIHYFRKYLDETLEIAVEKSRDIFHSTATELFMEYSDLESLHDQIDKLADGYC